MKGKDGCYTKRGLIGIRMSRKIKRKNWYISELDMFKDEYVGMGRQGKYIAGMRKLGHGRKKNENCIDESFQNK